MGRVSLLRAPWIGLAGAIAIGLPTPVQARPNSDNSPAQAPAAWPEVDRAVATQLAAHTAPGFAVAIARGGTIVFAKGYGTANLEDGAPVTAQTVFRIGSITKQFTAACILLLAEDGKLAIDDPLAKYLPDFPGADRITLRQMLTHTSGLHNYTTAPDFRTFTQNDRTTAEMVAYIAAQKPEFDFTPGTAYSYSNSGYYLLGAVIEKVSGQSYAAFLKQRVLDPLGLKDTAFDQNADVVPGRAAGYTAKPGTPSGFVNAYYASQSVAGAAGALRSTLADLVRWHNALLGGKLLNPASLAAMTTPGRLSNGRPISANVVAIPGVPPGPPFEYGFGLRLATELGHAAIGHGGAISGYNALVMSYPDSATTIVLLSNADGAAAKLEPSVAAAVLGPSRNQSKETQR